LVRSARLGKFLIHPPGSTGRDKRKPYQY
jgi:hypothetical protein